LESSACIRERTQRARGVQLERFAGGKMACNAEMSTKEARPYCPAEPAAQALLNAAVQQLHLSARALHRTLKLPRTIADAAGSDVLARCAGLKVLHGKQPAAMLPVPVSPGVIDCLLPSVLSLSGLDAHCPLAIDDCIVS